MRFVVVLHLVNKQEEQELTTLPEHMRSPPDLHDVRFTRSLFLCVCFVDR